MSDIIAVHQALNFRIATLIILLADRQTSLHQKTQYGSATGGCTGDIDPICINLPGCDQALLLIACPPPPRITMIPITVTLIFMDPPFRKMSSSTIA
jgi:16S rRNA G966 N2-methylase RsmD